MTFIAAQSADVWLNISAAPAVSIFQNGSDWEVRAGLITQSPLIRTLSSHSEAEDFVRDMLADVGVSPL